MIVPVKKLTIIALQEYEGMIMGELGKRGVVQLKPLDEIDFIGFKRVTATEVRDYAGLYDRALTLKEKLEEMGETLPKVEVEARKIPVKELREKLEKLEEKIVSLEDKRKRLEEDIENLEKLKPIIEMLAEKNINPEDLKETPLLYKKLGYIDSKAVDRVKRAFKLVSEIKHIITEKNGKAFILVISPRELEPWIERLLSMANFTEVQIPEDIPPKAEDAIKWIESQLTERKGELKELERQWIEEKEQIIADVARVIAEAKTSMRIAEGQGNLLRSQLMTVLQGWVPEDKIAEVNNFLKNLRKEAKELIIYSYEEPDPHESIPTVLKNPGLLKVYETLTRQYGIPDPRESDPTLVFSILWTIMFGFMFPDAGQGLVITLLGVIFAFVLKRPIMGMNGVKLGKLMIGLGISAMIFGLLFGEVFLIETTPLLPGLTTPGMEEAWLTRPTNIIRLIKIAVLFGLAQIILALLISIKNHIKEKEWVEAILGEHGLAGLITLIGIIIVGCEFLGVELPGIAFPEMKISVLTHWTILIPIIGIIGVAIAPILKGEGATVGMGVVIETVLSFVANSMSYIRIAAFCIAHAAFAMAVHEMLMISATLGIGLGLIFLNAFSLTLEMLIVMIQALRLLYYEFSTKFYRGSGIGFKPYRV